MVDHTKPQRAELVRNLCTKEDLLEPNKIVLKGEKNEFPFQDCIESIINSDNKEHIQLIKIQRQEMLKYNSHPTYEIQLLDEAILG